MSNESEIEYDDTDLPSYKRSSYEIGNSDAEASRERLSQMTPAERIREAEAARVQVRDARQYLSEFRRRVILEVM